MLKVRDLSASYGKHQALQGASLDVARGEIVVILGANGAGKTTLLKALCGISDGRVSGSVEMQGDELMGAPPEAIVEAGIALVPEGRGVFGDLTVQENLTLGAYATRARDDEAGNLERVLSLFPKLGERRRQVVRTMSGGEQQMVAIGRAMMSNPSILALDEPSLGLSPLLCKELFQSLLTVRKAGLGILLVEQNAKQSLAIADRGYLLENGKIVRQDTAKALAGDSAVQKAYLGGDGKAGAGQGTAPKPIAPVAAAPARPRSGPNPSDIASAALQSLSAKPRTSAPAPTPQAGAQDPATTHVASAPPKPAPPPAPPGRVDVGNLVARAAQQASRRPGPRAPAQDPAAPKPAPRPVAAPPTLPAVPMPSLAQSADRLKTILDEIETAARQAERYRPGLTRPDTRNR